MSILDTIKTNLGLIASEVNTTSATGILMKEAEAIAGVVDTTITEIENSKSIIVSAATNQRYGNKLYYETKAGEYQEGDDLVIDPLTFDYVYETVDTSKQIITQKAIQEQNVEGGRIFTLKVATTDPDTGELIALTNDQLVAFTAYMQNFEICDLPLLINSLDANVWDFDLNIKYYKSYSLDQLKLDVWTQLKAFRDSFNFSGDLYPNDVEEYLKANISAIRNVSLTLNTIDSYSFDVYSYLTAGYFNFEAGIEAKVNDSANYGAV